MPRRNLGPGEGKTYITFGLDREELDAMERVMRFYRCGQSAALRLLIRNGAEHTPMATPPSPPIEGNRP
jgi:hypothetical protein